MNILFFYLSNVLVDFYSTSVNKTESQSTLFLACADLVLLIRKKYVLEKLTEELGRNIINNSVFIYKKEKFQKAISGEQSCR